MSPQEAHLRRIAPCLFRLDLCAAHTITEDFTRAERLANIGPHFSYLWKKAVPPLATIERWVCSDELYDSYGVLNLPGFEEWVSGLDYEQLLTAVTVTNREACAFYIRLMMGRMWKAQEKDMIFGLAERDLPGAFVINLGLLIGERALDETDYFKRVIQKKSIAHVRLSRTMGEATLLRDQITAAYDCDAIDEEMLQILRMRASALDEHWHEAWKLLGEEKYAEVLLDAEEHAWLKPRDDSQASSRSDTELSSKASVSVLAVVSFLLTTIASFPAWFGFMNTPAVAGFWSDGNFLTLAAGAILQSLGLATQILGPLLLPGLFPNRLDPERRLVVWACAVFAVGCLMASILLYGLTSAAWSGIIGFAGQSTSGLVQLLLLFGT